MNDMDYLIKKLNLKKLWSNDFLAQIYHSPLTVPKENLPSYFDGDRKMYNWAYYLIPEGCICPFHLMYADESWQYCSGGPLELWIIEGENNPKKIIIGKDLKKDHSFFHLVQSNKWMAATPCNGSKYTLITHCVSPSFAEQDVIKGYEKDIIKLIPDYSDLVKKFSWPL